MKVKVKKLYPDAQLPTKGTKDSACFDLYAYKEGKDKHSWTIPPHSTLMIGTGLAFAPKHGYFGAMFPRSGLSTKEGLRLANCVGIFDEDYRGEYIAAIHNDSSKPKTIEHGERICQLLFLPYPEVNLKEVEELDETERGVGGFGSTGRL
jgi:dUTP pyrophosphatase